MSMWTALQTANVAEACRPFFTPSLAYGVYNFRADLPVDGNWALTFHAKVPGEPQLIAGTVTFSVVGRLSAAASPTAGPR